MKTFKSETLTESCKVLAQLWASGAVSEGSYKNIFWHSRYERGLLRDASVESGIMGRNGVSRQLELSQNREQTAPCGQICFSRISSGILEWFGLEVKVPAAEAELSLMPPCTNVSFLMPRLHTEQSQLSTPREECLFQSFASQVSPELLGKGWKIMEKTNVSLQGVPQEQQDLPKEWPGKLPREIPVHRWSTGATTGTPGSHPGCSQSLLWEPTARCF